ncbi:3'-phosphoadenylsulfate reductase [Saccharomyces pastorianus]|uniref:3'-phosphoadenylsulfate reductase n=1 Tax=Saccharomyces pastorianus TaxID=27292 RepID=A0A6C1EIZ3_SACPS|nr:3'-phosphoadenylsulfate reductase [Saccharomyces pastorianus]
MVASGFPTPFPNHCVWTDRFGHHRHAVETIREILYAGIIIYRHFAPFPQTLTLKDTIEQKYYQPQKQTIHVYKPDGCVSEAEFASKYGDFLWEKDDDKYDYLAKVEPAHRAYKELRVSAVFTGRRKSQGSARSVVAY